MTVVQLNHSVNVTLQSKYLLLHSETIQLVQRLVGSEHIVFIIRVIVLSIQPATYLSQFSHYHRHGISGRLGRKF